MKRNRTFISYKSENANIARQVVDILISEGVDVWFAEYEVLPNNYERFDADLESNLEEAVSTCNQAILFTNTNWALSEYCQKEMCSMKKHGIPSSNITIIAIPRENEVYNYYPELNSIHTYEFQGDIYDTVTYILTKLKKNIHIKQQNIQNYKNKLSFKGYGLEMKSGFLKILIRESKILAKKGMGNTVILDGYVMKRNVRIILTSSLYESVIHQLSISELGNSDDRKVYTAYRKYAKQWATTESMDILGLHLVFIGGKSQFALTYCSNKESSLHVHWERRYVISLKNLTGEPGEIGATVYCPPKKNIGLTFNEFLGICSCVEPLIETIKTIPPERRKWTYTDIATLIISTGYFVLPLIIGVILFKNGNFNFEISFLGAFSGINSGFVLKFIQLNYFRRWYRTLTPIIEERGDGFEQFSSSLLLNMFILPIILLFFFLLDCKNVYSSSSKRIIPSLTWPMIGILIGLITSLEFGIPYLALFCGFISGCFGVIHLLNKQISDLGLK